MADIFYGLLVVGRNGGLATQLAAGVDGQKFSFPESVAVDEPTGDAYFVDAGDIFKSLYDNTLITFITKFPGRPLPDI